MGYAGDERHFRPFFPSMCQQGAYIAKVHRGDHPNVPPTAVGDAEVIDGNARGISRMGDRRDQARDGSSVGPHMLGVDGGLDGARVVAEAPISAEGVLGVLIRLTPLRLYAPAPFTQQLGITVSVGVWFVVTAGGATGPEGPWVADHFYASKRSG